MAIERKTIIDQIEITGGGEVRTRFGLLLVEGDKVLSVNYHRTIFDVGSPNCVALTMYSVNTHLVSMGEQPLPQEQIDRIAAHVALVESQLKA